MAGIYQIVKIFLQCLAAELVRRFLVGASAPEKNPLPLGASVFTVKI
jgi:hypothetical protein